MNAHAETSVTSVSSVQSLLDLLDGIVPGETYVSGGMKKCEHFKAFGKPDDFTKRLIIHLSDLSRERDEFTRNFKKKDMYNKVDTVFANSEEEQRAGVDSVQQQQKLFEVQYNSKNRQINYVSVLLQEEIIRQFPEADNKDIDHLFVDEDWTVGWIDHTNLHEELIGAMFGGGASGAQPDDFPEFMAMGPDGKIMSVDEALRGFPPEVADVMKRDISEIVGSVRGRTTSRTRGGNQGLAAALAAIAASIGRGRRFPGQ